MGATAQLIKPARLEVTPDALFGKNAQQLMAWRHSLSHRFLLYGGAAGGGKSFFLRWCAVFYLMVLFKFFQVRKPQVILACEDYPTLKDRQIGKMQAEFPAGLGRLVLGETRDFVLADKYGGGRILLRNLDDPSKYLSTEFAGVFVDELTRNKEQTFHDLRLRMRWPGVARPIFVGSTNPGGQGHAWVQKFWIDRKFPAEMKKLEHEFVFVQAKANDNPFLSQQYYEDLGTLDEKMRAAYLEGRWDLFAGQYFTNWSRERHIGKRAGSEIVCPKSGQRYRIDYHQVGAPGEGAGSGTWLPGAWPKWVSLDWGFAHESVVFWHATAPNGRHITYREWAVKGITPRMLGEGIVERSVDSEGRPERISQFFVSPDAFADREGQSTIAEQIRDVACRGDRFPLPAAASDDRVGGWQLLYHLLESDGWLVAENCERLIERLPTLIHDDKHPEDVKKVDGDDAPDSARYGLYSRLGAAKAPKEVRAAKAVEGLADPTARAIAARRFEAAESKAGQPVPVGRRHGPHKGINTGFGRR